MKLRTKIQLFSSLFMLVLIILVNTSIYYLFYNISADNELKQLYRHTDTIVETLHNNPDLSYLQMLTSFVPENGIIRVIDQNNVEIVPPIARSEEFTELAFEFLDYEKGYVETDAKGTLIAVVNRPIIWETGKVVTLQVANYLLILDEAMQTLLYVLVAASLIILIPTIIAGNLLSRFIIQPIQKLIETMRANMQQSNWQTIAVTNKSKDEIYEMEKTFNELITHLKESFSRQEQFVSDASHELKTPLAIIKSYIQLLERRAQSHPEVITESIEAIQSETERMQQLINQLLDLARNKETFPFTKVNIVPIAENVAHTFRAAADREIVFHTHAEEIFVNGNKKQIEQIIYILLSNAMKYSDAQVIVNVYREQNDAVIDVTDFGPGISREVQDKIFDRFYRVDEARTRHTGGTGLGLAIAKEIAAAHRGNLTVTSELGKGSTFSLRLPLDENNLT